MIKNFIAAFIDYFVVIDPVGTPPIFLAITTQLNKRQARREHGNDTLSTDDNIAIFPLATSLLAGPAAITSVMVVARSPAGKLDIFIGYGAMAAVMLATAMVLIIASLAESDINPRVTLVFSRITAIILAALSIQYIIDGLQALGLTKIID